MVGVVSGEGDGGRATEELAVMSGVGDGVAMESLDVEIVSTGADTTPVDVEVAGSVGVVEEAVTVVSVAGGVVIIIGLWPLCSRSCFN